MLHFLNEPIQELVGVLLDGSVDRLAVPVLVGVAELSGDDVLFMAQFEVVEEALELPHKVVDYHLAVQLSLLAVGGDGLSEH